MRRFAFAIIVGLLTLSTSGMSSLFVAEPCSDSELASGDDGGCPPTCVTCGCCAQAAEPALIAVANSPDVPVTDSVAVLPQCPTTDPRDILHVPRLSVA